MTHMRIILELIPTFWYPFSLLSVLLVIFLTTWLFSTSKTSENSPPSPPKLPILGNLHQLGLYPHHSLRYMAQRHGPFMLLQLGRFPTLVISSPELAKEIMKIHDQNFSNRSATSITRKLLYDHKDLVTTPYGVYWKQMRSICMLQLLNTKRVRSYHFIRDEETKLMISKIIQQSCSCSSPINLSEPFVNLAKDIVGRIIFSWKCSEGERGKRLNKLLDEYGKLLGAVSVGEFIPWLGWIDYVTGLTARVERVFKEFDGFLEGIVDAHMASGRENQIDDVVDVLLQIQRDNKTCGYLSRESIKAIILDMFVGGTDTTYTTLEWTMTELLRHPKVMKEVQKEIRTIIGEKQNITEDELEEMQFLKAVIKESFRLHPPVPLLFPPESTKDVRIEGYNIPAKSRAIINVWAIARDPNMWEDPEEFRPERFLNCPIKFRGHDFQLIPFGAGRRGCPGATFAVSIIELALAKILQRFDWEVADEGRRLALDLTESPGLTVPKKFPLVAVATNCS